MNKSIVGLCLFICFICSTSHALSAVNLKLAFLAPEGVTWTKNIEKMAKDIEEKTQKRVTFKFYFGGVSGDESDMLRKVRSSQLSGGMFTGKTLGDIDKDTRALEIPFTFQKKPEKAISSLQEMAPTFSSSLEKKGFHSLGFLEVGHVYLGTTKHIKNLDGLKGSKIWIWEGDKIAEAMIESLQLVSVPLSLPDVLSSLSSGIIDAAYAPPLGMTALQWHTKIKYIINHPLAYATGALIVSMKEWNKISKEDQNLINSIAKTYLDEANAQTHKDNLDTLEEFSKLGIQLIEFPKSDIEKVSGMRKQVVEKLSKNFFSSQILQKVESIHKSL